MAPEVLRGTWWPSHRVRYLAGVGGLEACSPWTLISASKPWKKPPPASRKAARSTEPPGASSPARACGGRTRGRSRYNMIRGALEDGPMAYADADFHFYNTQRPHQALGYRTPGGVQLTRCNQMTSSKERRWPASRALVYLGKTAGPSLITLPQCCPTDGVHLNLREMLPSPKEQSAPGLRKRALGRFSECTLRTMVTHFPWEEEALAYWCCTRERQLTVPGRFRERLDRKIRCL